MSQEVRRSLIFKSSTIPRWLRTLGRVLLFCLSCAAVLIASSSLTQWIAGPWSSVSLAVIASLGAFALTVLFVRWEGLQLKDVGAMPGRQSLPRVALGFLIGLLLVVLQSGLVGGMGHIHWVRLPGTGVAPAMFALMVYFVLAVREEVAFHGYPLRSLDRSIGIWGAQLIVAVIFALEHVAGGMTWLQAFSGAAVGSLLFGMASLTTRGLAMPIGIHAAWNFGQWMLGEKDSSGFWHPVIEKGFEGRVELAGSISYLLVMGLAILAFCWYRKAHGGNSEECAPRLE